MARDYRNRRVGDFLKELHLTEGRGTGIPTIKRSLEKNESPAPIFETDDQSTYFLTILMINPDFNDQVSDQVSDQVIRLLEYAQIAKSRKELLKHIGLINQLIILKGIYHH